MSAAGVAAKELKSQELDVDDGQEESEASDDVDDDTLYHMALADDEFEASREYNRTLLQEYRHQADPVRECWQEYVGSVGTSARRELHEAKIAAFRGHGPDPAPIFEGAECFNPLFECRWLPWAINAGYCHNDDMGLLLSELQSGTDCMVDLRMLARDLMSCAVPTRPVLEYMVERAPDKRIAEIGSGSGYWATLLKRLGADILAVADPSENVSPDRLACFPDTIFMDGEQFVRRGMAKSRALFFCWPSKRVEIYGYEGDACLAERCLSCFSGDTIFFVGEIGERANSFDMVQWVQEHRNHGWRLEEEIEIPCWPGFHDIFLCCVKEKLEKPVADTSCHTSADDQHAQSD